MASLLAVLRKQLSTTGMPQLKLSRSCRAGVNPLDGERAHPLFLVQLDALAQRVEALEQKDPIGYVNASASKRLAAITKLAFDTIPQDPARPEHRQGGALDDDRKHCFRAKFCRQYRLFYRYHARIKLIVLAWVNDEDTKRGHERSDDA